ncbi:unnamed protein product [Amoebophrya sp. A25]|nr:unnamed protein product [Amoebophrya sp. A25]|eukprot:GSA25T00002626001.1
MVDAQAAASMAFLQENVGEALTEAFTALSLAQPADAVDFLSTFLLQYGVSAGKKASRDKENSRIAALKAKLGEENAYKERVAADAKAKEDATEKRYADCLEALKVIESWSEETWEEVCHNACAVLGGTAGYLGVLDATREEPELHYTHGQPLMVNQLLKASEGVTHKIFEEVPPPEVEEGQEHLLAAHKKFQHVACDYVTDVPEVKYFSWMKLGAYCAVPMIYPGYLTLDALATFLEYERNPPQPPEPEEGADPDPDWTPPKPEPAATEVKMAFAVDSLSTNKKLKMGEVERVYTLAAAAGEAKSRVEFEDVWKQAKMYVKGSEFVEEFEKLQGAAPDVASVVAAYKDAREGADLTETEQALAETEAAFQVACKAVEGVLPAVETLSACAVVPPEVVAVVRCIGYLVGFDDTTCCGGPHKEASWALLKKVIPGLGPKLVACSMTSPRLGISKEQRFPNIQSLKPEAIADPVEMGSFGFSVLWYWLQAACTVREAYLADEKAKYDEKRAVFEGHAEVMARYYELLAEKAAKEAAGEDPPEVGEKPEPVTKPTPLSEIDDDFKTE